MAEKGGQAGDLATSEGMEYFKETLEKHPHWLVQGDKKPSQDDLEWVEGTFGLEPRWTKEPDIDKRHSIYKITTAESDSAYLMRISLPVDPYYKTASEIATIEFVGEKTQAPVPRIIAFDSSNENELSFEWILMEMMPGATLRKRWRKMSWEAKTEIVVRIARLQAQLFRKRFKSIGNVFAKSDDGNGQTEFVLGPIVSLIFFWGDHLTHNVHRGPFQKSSEWLRTRLQFAITDEERILAATEDEDEIEDAEFAKALAENLLQSLETVFSSGEEYHTILFHEDLSMENILVNDEGALTAVIDWECVSAVPLWRACQPPQFLEGPSREDEPQKTDYGPESETEEQDDADDNEGVYSLYWEHFLEFERTKLRKLFVDEMEKLEPA